VARALAICGSSFQRGRDSGDCVRGLRFTLSKVDLAMFFMAPTWPPREAYADGSSDQCQLRVQERKTFTTACSRSSNRPWEPGVDSRAVLRARNDIGPSSARPPRTFICASRQSAAAVSLTRQSLPKRDVRVTSAYPSISDMTSRCRERRFGPTPEVRWRSVRGSSAARWAHSPALGSRY
jgi:hypothetical protein